MSNSDYHLADNLISIGNYRYISFDYELINFKSYDVANCKIFVGAKLIVTFLVFNIKSISSDLKFIEIKRTENA